MKSLKTLFAIFLLHVFVYSGCKEDNPVTPPPGSGDSLGGNLVSFPNELIINTNDTILFRFTVNPGTVFIDSLAKLVKVDGSNNEIQQIGTLQDNGVLSNGDDIAKDNIYSGRFIFNEASSGKIKLRAKGNISQNSTRYSQVVEISVYDQLTSQNLNILLNTQTNARNQLQTLLGGNPANIENAANQLKTWLMSQPGVVSVEKGGSTSILIKYASGLSGGLIFSVLNSNGQITTRGGYGGVDSSRRSLTREIPVDEQTIGVNLSNRVSINITDNTFIDPYTIGNRNVLIYSAFETAFAPFNERQKNNKQVELISMQRF